jgi:CheY-like chemotaxis protein
MYITASEADFDLLATLLADDDVELVHFTTGISALLTLDKSTSESLPNLILCAWNLALMTGAEFTGGAKRLDRVKSIPILVIAEPLTAEQIADLYACGAACVLRQPWAVDDVSDLCSALKTVWVRHAQPCVRATAPAAAPCATL